MWRARHRGIGSARRHACSWFRCLNPLLRRQFLEMSVWTSAWGMETWKRNRVQWLLSYAEIIVVTTCHTCVVSSTFCISFSCSR
jgi:hypothetical protein